jgi:hypothetical protein
MDMSISFKIVVGGAASNEAPRIAAVLNTPEPILFTASRPAHSKARTVSIVWAVFFTGSVI